MDAGLPVCARVPVSAPVSASVGVPLHPPRATRYARYALPATRYARYALPAFAFAYVRATRYARYALRATRYARYALPARLPTCLRVCLRVPVPARYLPQKKTVLLSQAPDIFACVPARTPRRANTSPLVSLYVPARIPGRANKVATSAHICARAFPRMCPRGGVTVALRGDGPSPVSY